MRWRRCSPRPGSRSCREYYINDAGAQVDALARSLYLRYREALGEEIGAIPEGLYPGDYLKDTARSSSQRDGRKWLGTAGERYGSLTLREFAVADMMRMIRDDLAALGVSQDVFTSERALVAAGAIEDALQDA